MIHSQDSCHLAIDFSPTFWLRPKSLFSLLRSTATATTTSLLSRGPFLESAETFRAHFRWHNPLCIFETKASRGTKLCSYFNLYSLYNIWKGPALQSKRVRVLRIAFRARKGFRTFEKRALDLLHLLSFWEHRCDGCLRNPDKCKEKWFIKMRSKCQPHNIFTILIWRLSTCMMPKISRFTSQRSLFKS